jgi:hypothetical protein
MKIIKVQALWTKYLSIKEKINPNAIDLRNGTILTNKIEGFKERIEAMLLR